jgi:hypothetical protein
MPRRVTLSIECPGVSARDLFSCMYGSDEFLRGFHSRVNKCASPDLPPFAFDPSAAAFSRVVKYSVPVNAPSVVVRLIGGSEMLDVLERQTVVVGAAGRNTEGEGEGGAKERVRISLTSEPRPQLGGMSDGFTSDAEVDFVDVANEGGLKGCRVDAAVNVAAGMAPYGTRSVIEKFMADTALESLGGLLNLMKVRYSSLVEAGALEEEVRMNVGRDPELHEFLGVEKGAREVVGQPSLGEDTIFYDDRNEEVLEALRDVSEEVRRVRSQLNVLVDRLEIERREREMGAREIAVSLKVQVVPLAISTCIATSLVAGAYILLHRNARVSAYLST